MNEIDIELGDKEREFNMMPFEMMDDESDSDDSLYELYEALKKMTEIIVFHTYEFCSG